MRARSVLARVIVAVSTVTALTIGSGTTAAHAAPPGITIADASITEGNAGTSAMSFTLSYGGAPTAGVTVNYATSNATATAGSDYVATSGTATLSATGCKCGTINVSIIGDTVAENTETFHVDLSNPVNKTLDDNLGIGTITDNDVPSASINDPTVAENGGTMTFTVTLDSSAPFNSVIGYTSTAGTATAGSDFTSVSNNLTITAGSTTDSKAPRYSASPEPAGSGTFTSSCEFAPGPPEPGQKGHWWTETVRTVGSSAKSASVPLPWCTSKSTIATRG